jgi:hypothetical protein
MRPRSKGDRLVLTEVLLECAGVPRDPVQTCSSGCMMNWPGDAWLVGRVTGQEFAKGEPYRDQHDDDHGDDHATDAALVPTNDTIDSEQIPQPSEMSRWANWLGEFAREEEQGGSRVRKARSTTTMRLEWGPNSL